MAPPSSKPKPSLVMPHRGSTTIVTARRTTTPPAWSSSTRSSTACAFIQPPRARGLVRDRRRPRRVTSERSVREIRAERARTLHHQRDERHGWEAARGPADARGCGRVLRARPALCPATRPLRVPDSLELVAGQHPVHPRRDRQHRGRGACSSSTSSCIERRCSTTDHLARTLRPHRRRWHGDVVPAVRSGRGEVRAQCIRTRSRSIARLVMATKGARRLFERSVVSHRLPRSPSAGSAVAYGTEHAVPTPGSRRRRARSGGGTSQWTTVGYGDIVPKTTTGRVRRRHDHVHRRRGARPRLRSARELFRLDPSTAGNHR